MRLTRRDDSGVTSILVVLFAVLLLGAVAIAVDVGRAVAVARSAQNSADAVALAMAKDCVGPRRTMAGPATYDRFIRTGAAIANGQSQTLEAGGCGAGFVKARATETMNYTFAKVLGMSNKMLSRPATAKWGELASGVVFPFTFSACSFPDTFTSGNATTPGTLMMLYGQGVTQTSCARDSSTVGQAANSKGFVFGGCQLTSIGGALTDAQGNNFVGTNCDDHGAGLDFYVGTDVLLPVWGAATGNPSNYTITYLVGFHVLGWSGNGSARGGAMSKNCEAIGGFTGSPTTQGDKTKPCLYGYVTSFTSTVGGTTGAPCFASPLSSACFVYLDS
jgi:Flp pilus assembly protein TadG